MVFSSITFIVYFLPAFLAVYFLMPDRGKNAVIFTASLIFYYYGVKEHPEYLLLMLISVIVNYTAARFIERCSTKRSRAAWLAAGLIWNFGSLFTFKYMDFISENINALLSAFNAGVSLPLVKLVLPIGISFYTFQISSYLIDVYNKKNTRRALDSYSRHIPVHVSAAYCGTDRHIQQHFKAASFTRPLNAAF